MLVASRMRGYEGMAYRDFTLASISKTFDRMNNAVPLALAISTEKARSVGAP